MKTQSKKADKKPKEKTEKSVKYNQIYFESY